MANQWFKFYGGEYLGDQKMFGLSTAQRSCWITLLCCASQSNGVVKYLTEEQLMLQAGVNFQEDEWERTKGVLELFKKLDMLHLRNGIITVKNWKKRQEIYLSNSERQARYRKSNAVVTEPVTLVTLEESRVDKNRIDKIHTSQTYLSSIPSEDLKEFTQRFEATERQVKSKAEDLQLYCNSKGKVYKNYKAFLLNALKKDFIERPPKKEASPPPKVEDVATPEQRKAIKESIEKIRSSMTLKR